MDHLKGYLFYSFEASGETSSTDNGPFTLGEIIQYFEYVRVHAPSIDKLTSLNVGEKFMWGMVKTLTRLPNNEETYRLYLENKSRRKS